MNKTSILLCLIATLVLAGCSSTPTTNKDSSQNNNESSETESSLSSQSTDSNESSESTNSSEISQDQESETSTEIINKPSKEVKFSMNTLDSSSIIPYSYQPSGVELDVDDLHLFANYITYDYNGTQEIYLKENTGFIRNLNPINGLTSIRLSTYDAANVYVSDDFNSESWMKLNQINGEYKINNKKYFKIQSTNENIAFDYIKFKYIEADQTFVNPAYNIKEVKELTSKAEADALIQYSSQAFTNSSKWQQLGYASDYNEAKSQAENGKLSGFNGKTDYQVPYNKNLLLNKKKNSYRIADMQYGDNGNSFRINMLDGSEGPVIYKGCAYTFADDIAAYITAFGDVPPNMQYDKNDKKSAVADWGIYGRVNYNFYHNNARGKFSFETEVPTHRYYFNPSQNSTDYWYKYYESDYGASVGNDEPYQLTTKYYKGPYNTGKIDQRGALRFVWSKSYSSSAHTSKGGSPITNSYDRNVFYTSNHYNDFQQYLNYYHGWSLSFGNTTIGNGWEEYVPSNHYDQAPKVLLTSLKNIKNA